MDSVSALYRPPLLFAHVMHSHGLTHSVLVAHKGVDEGVDEGHAHHGDAAHNNVFLHAGPHVWPQPPHAGGGAVGGVGVGGAMGAPMGLDNDDDLFDDDDDDGWVANDDMPLEELVGLVGPWHALVDNVLWIVLINAAILFAFAKVPAVIGSAMAAGLGLQVESVWLHMLLGWSLITVYAVAHVSLPRAWVPWRGARDDSLTARCFTFGCVFVKVTDTPSLTCFSTTASTPPLA
jgi:hypothetical protein